MSFENHAGFNISNSKLQVVEINYKRDQFFLENVDEAYFNEPIDFATDKETKISALLQGAFNELLIRKPLSSQSVSFTLPFQYFYMMQIPYDNTLLHNDLLEEFRWEFSILYPFLQIKHLSIQYIELEKNDIVHYNSALVIAIPRKFIQLIQNFCKQNNLNLRFVDNLHFAAERALTVCQSLAEKGIVLSIYINNKFLSAIIHLHGKPVLFKVVPLADASQITPILNDILTPKPSLNISKKIIDAAFIAGDHLSSSMVQTLRKAVAIDFIQYNPFNKIKPSADLYKSNCYTEKPNTFSSAAGIAFRLA